MRIIFANNSMITINCNKKIKKDRYLRFFRLEMISFGDDIIEIIPYLLYIIIIVLYPFIGNYFGPELTDYNKEVSCVA